MCHWHSAHLVTTKMKPLLVNYLRTYAQGYNVLQLLPIPIPNAHPSTEPNWEGDFHLLDLSTNRQYCCSSHCFGESDWPILLPMVTKRNTI